MNGALRRGAGLDIGEDAHRTDAAFPRQEVGGEPPYSAGPRTGAGAPDSSIASTSPQGSPHDTKPAQKEAHVLLGIVLSSRVPALGHRRWGWSNAAFWRSLSGSRREAVACAFACERNSAQRVIRVPPPMVGVAQSCVDRPVGETRVAVSLEFQSTALAERLASLLEAARPMPLTRIQVRVDKRAVYQLVAELRAAVRAEEAGGRITAAAAFSILSAADDVHDAVFNARPSRLVTIGDARTPAEGAVEFGASGGLRFVPSGRLRDPSGDARFA
jgi:hypothetical protein